MQRLPSRTLLARLPKTELHLHLDGSLPFEFVSNSAQSRNVPCPASPQELRQYLHDLKSQARTADHTNAQQKNQNWGVFDWCNQFLQTREELTQAAAMICTQAKQHHNVHRVELRFCPTLHTNEKLTPREAVDAVAQGVPDTGGVIVCALRSHDAQHSIDMAQLTIDAHRATNGKVCGFDIAGDEGSWPLHLHQEAIQLCKAHHIPVTVHAGEWPNTIANVARGLELGVDRIGHGWGMATHPDVMQTCVDRQVPVEICLTSNVKPGAGQGWVESYATHPVRQLYDAGVKLCVNSDNHLLSGGADRAATPTGEIEHLMHDCGFALHEIVGLLRNGLEVAFIKDEEQRKDMLTLFDVETTTVLALIEEEEQKRKG